MPGDDALGQQQTKADAHAQLDYARLEEDIAAATYTLPGDALAEIERIHFSCLVPAR